MKIISGKQQQAQKVVVYGPEGVGKSTFASMFPRPLFIDTEGSTDNLDVDRVKPLSWTELLSVVGELINGTDYKTLVIDTADWAEKLCTEAIVAKNRWSGIEDSGYGKGYVYVAEEFGRLLNTLEQLKSKGMNVVFTAHAMLRKFEQPDEMNAYDRWELKLSKKGAPLLKEWADMILFANYKTYVVTKDGKSKATGGTKRMMYTEHTAVYDAKNRHGLASELPFEYASIAHVIPVEEVPKAITSKPQRKKTEPAPEALATETPAPVEVQKQEEKPAVNYDGIPDALAALMAVNQIVPLELQGVVAQRGYYPVSTPISKYDPQFIQGCLIAAWPQVEQAIIANRKEAPF